MGRGAPLSASVGGASLFEGRRSRAAPRSQPSHPQPCAALHRAERRRVRGGARRRRRSGAPAVRDRRHSPNRSTTLERNHAARGLVPRKRGSCNNVGSGSWSKEERGGAPFSAPVGGASLFEDRRSRAAPGSDGVPSPALRGPPSRGTLPSLRRGPPAPKKEHSRAPVWTRVGRALGSAAGACTRDPRFERNHAARGLARIIHERCGAGACYAPGDCRKRREFSCRHGRSHACSGRARRP